jgi:predicted helicase
MNEEVYQFPKIFPSLQSENENQVIGMNGLGLEKPFSALIFNIMPDLNMISPGAGGTQSFPFYIYNEDGSHRQENLTDWALKDYQVHYADEKISKWDIFYYVYGLLHHQGYRDKYAANLKRELPRIPKLKEFWKLSHAGKKLAELHLNYETQKEYPLQIQSNGQIDLRVEKMRFNKEKTAIKYNDSLTLSGIPPEALEYKLGNRSALNWIIDQYQISTDKRSGITNDPNNLEDESYIVKLIMRIVTVSVETVGLVKEISGCEL